MASIKPRKRENDSASRLKALDAEMQRAFSMKMGQLKRVNRDIHEEDPDSGVIYVSHIPHGFYEPQMKKFFSQFGNVKRLRLSRSKKSGRSKGYAYIEFEFSEVAKVVAETMHNYLMYQKLLKCFYVPKEKLHPDTFKGCFRHFKRPRRREIAAARNNNLLESGKEHILESQKRRVTSLAKKQKKLEKLGINFKIEGVESEWQRLKESNPPAPKVETTKKPSASKVTGKSTDRNKKPAGKSDKSGPAKRKRTRKPAAKSAVKSKKQQVDASGDRIGSESVAMSKKDDKNVKAPALKQNVSSKSRKPKEQMVAHARTPSGHVKASVKKKAQSAKVSLKGKSPKSVRTAGKKTKRLSL